MKIKTKEEALELVNSPLFFSLPALLPEKTMPKRFYLGVINGACSIGLLLRELLKEKEKNSQTYLLKNKNQAIEIIHSTIILHMLYIMQYYLGLKKEEIPNAISLQGIQIPKTNIEKLLNNYHLKPFEIELVKDFCEVTDGKEYFEGVLWFYGRLLRLTKEMKQDISPSIKIFGNINEIDLVAETISLTEISTIKSAVDFL